MPTQKKALLIGISHLTGQKDLAGPGHDVIGMRDLLQEYYGYEPQDICILLDSWKRAQHRLPPTKENILDAIDNLVKDCHSGDQFIFHYSGHTDQIPNEDGSEEDNMDECLMTNTGEILDDELKRRLVEPLCPGSKLVAILDTCHSETLLDLPHHHCNDVPMPWRNERKESLDPTRSIEEARWHITDVAMTLRGYNHFRRYPTRFPRPVALTLDIPAFTADVVSPAQSSMTPTEALYCESPMGITIPALQISLPNQRGNVSHLSHPFCIGTCSPFDPVAQPHVIAISSDSHFLLQRLAVLLGE
ncbi:hypothetical protein HGRIS_010670 [Hohenbuehelia grisea]|uniref:Peptidase C14 caspase domain-containing protein n=1 Tax=Hohenbuehelia grisea TaxID=104357 RepID=A0ABR3IXW3_9AGAR